MIDALPLLLGPEGYQISRSVRLRSSASASFSRTPASASNRKTWTWSGWVKRGGLGYMTLLDGGSTGPLCDLQFSTTDNLRLYVTDTGITNSEIPTTTAVFRDPSAWYHIVCAVDTTQATVANRVKFYVNGVQQVITGLTGTIITQNSDLGMNRAVTSYLGVYSNSTTAYFDGYLTEINFIDGQALTPSSFGETNVTTGVWQPKKYAGTYGTNGFYLNFSDPSAATAAAIGADRSGNGNNWTPNNISVTAGATYDSMLDVPTPWPDGGNGRGNYCVMNPLSSNASMTITGGNLNITSSVASQGFNAYSSVAVLTGKWYVEATVNTGADADMIGVCPSTLLASSGRFDGLAGGVGYYRDGRKFIAGVATTYGASYTTGDVIGIALDMDAQTVEFFKNGTSQGTISSSLTAGVPYYFVTGDASAGTGINQSWNFGQRPFTYTPPTGFRALNTQNLPVPTILKGNQYFDATTYTGNGSTLSVTNSGAMQPDMVWIKSRSNAFNHWLTDSVRGVTKQLGPNQTIAEVTASNCVTSFDASGFSIGNDAGHNTNAATYVGWQWKEGATQGFDIVTYTGDGANRTIAHNLGVAPKMIFLKSRSNAYNWIVYHANLTSAAFYLSLNQTIAQTSLSTIWNSTAPTSSVFSLGTDNSVNQSSATYVAYLFSEVAGFSRFGSYTGNGSADGVFVHLGFRPRYVLTKSSSTGGVGFDWSIYDSARNTSNVGGSYLWADLSNAEGAADGIDFLSNGFKIRNTSSQSNQNGVTYIYAAFAENPFKYALAR